jgi:tetratricopeptide (TPR) repeat protein
VIYRDETVALRARVEVLERQVAETEHLRRRVAVLEVENDELRARLTQLRGQLREALGSRPGEHAPVDPRVDRRYHQNIDSLRSLADSARSDRVRCEYLLQIARIYARRLHQIDRAREVYTEVLRIDPSYEVAARELEKL